MGVGSGFDIVIDFDGTVVTHDFPRVGRDVGAVPVLRQLVDAGHRLILFTMRSDVVVSNGVSRECSSVVTGNFLQDAVDWFADNDIPLYGVQTNPDQLLWTSSPKAYGQFMIDDTALGCPLKFDLSLSGRPFVDWGRMRELLVLSGLLSHSQL